MWFPKESVGINLAKTTCFPSCPYYTASKRALRSAINQGPGLCAFFGFSKDAALKSTIDLESYIRRFTSDFRPGLANITGSNLIPQIPTNVPFKWLLPRADQSQGESSLFS